MVPESPNERKEVKPRSPAILFWQSFTVSYGLNNNLNCHTQYIDCFGGQGKRRSTSERGL